MLLLLVHLGCSSWTEVNFDYDNKGLFEGDCWFGTDPIPPEGALDHGIRAEDIYEGALDLPYDGIDANCDGKDDFDADGDGYIPQEYAGIQTLGLEYTGNLPTGDCLDDPALAPQDFAAERIYPDAQDEWYDGVDSNCDGKNDYDADEDGFESSIHPQTNGTVGDDCDDTLDSINPSAVEVCDNGIDNDCDGLIDDLDSSLDTDSLHLFYIDLDADSFGDMTDVGQYFCSAPTGFVVDNSDCNDADPFISPDGIEIAVDGVDQNCDALELCYEDADGDGFGVALIESVDFSCSGIGLSVLNTDCDDENSVVAPDAVEEAGDALDSNCDGIELCFLDLDSDDYRTNETIETTNIDCSGATESLLNTLVDCDDNASDTFPGSANLDSATACMKDSDGDGYGDINITGSVVVGSDCNDGNALISPAAIEVCDGGVDNDCDGLLDDADPSVNTSSLPLYYLDDDGDGFGDETDSGVYSCSAPVGYVVNNTDCNDSDDFYNPDTEWYSDSDSDGFGDITNTTTSCTQPVGYVLDSTDCDDLSNTINPDAIEIAGDEIDSNCDDIELCYEDLDGDGFRTNNTNESTNIDCSGSMEAEIGILELDCNDANALINAAAPEIVGDGVDQNCNGTEICYLDSDNDDFRSQIEVPSADTDCNDNQEALSSADIDCDDLSASVNPNHPDTVGNGIDNNCDGIDGIDGDLDGYASEASGGADCDDSTNAINPNQSDTVGDTIDNNCDGIDGIDGDLDGYASEASGGTDCNDLNAEISPAATEICDANVDNDCDGLLDLLDDSLDTTSFPLYYTDFDNDGYGSTDDVGILSCTVPSGRVLDNTDCEDGDEAIFPNADELCNGIDDNCDTFVDESSALDASLWYLDSDSDTFGNASITQVSCEQPSGYVDNDLDCDDSDPNSVPQLYYADIDNDTFGDSTDPGALACSAPTDTVSNNTDCDDTNGNIYPYATEDADNTDDNCDGLEDNNIETCFSSIYNNGTSSDNTDDVYFLFCETSTSWAVARSYCEDHGYDLTSIRNSGENTHITSKIHNDSWIGFYDIDNGIGCNSNQNYHFVWTDGYSIDYYKYFEWNGQCRTRITAQDLTVMFWASGEPNATSTYSYMYIKTDGYWYDNSGSATKYFICSHRP